jgi:hypothetical protein
MDFVGVRTGMEEAILNPPDIQPAETNEPNEESNDDHYALSRLADS